MTSNEGEVLRVHLENVDQQMMQGDDRNDFFLNRENEDLMKESDICIVF